MEQTIDGVVITAADGVILYANPAFVRSSGQGLDALIGQPAADVAADMAGPAALAGIAAAAVAGKPWLGEVDRTLPDGTFRHLQVSVTPTHNGLESVNGFVVVTRDVTALRDAEAEIALEGHIRLALAACLRAIPDDATLEQAAQTVCEELVGIRQIDLAVVEAVIGADELRVVAAAAPAGMRIKAGDRLPVQAARGVVRRAAHGPWAQYWNPQSAYGRWGQEYRKAGLKAIAFGPIFQGDQLLGGVLIGTSDEVFAHTLVEKMPALMSISGASSALLARRLRTVQRNADLHHALASMLAAGASHPVFQPVVDLESGGVVGYEALTRFDSGQRPDLCFADAWSVGLGQELELVTLERSVAAARSLPSGRWLTLNVSPRLLSSPGRLAATLGSADRPIVLEVTEHDLIDDYGVVREAVRSLGQHVRLAVDDAGAGAANFSHIVELRPDFVKLDMGLVRGVNEDLGRQAMVIGMQHFSRTAGCRLIAEGIESAEEARCLLELGVEFGQGYFFGRPEPAGRWQPHRRRRPEARGSLSAAADGEVA